ncbi:unnamed protein product [Ostreobium quekettii]|uniref:Expansin-like EG45 domain-containing protein n=1 Tax=Ostreobium quekettii TaxID=121088 RepID=A0A8S1IMA0_9CHLO|nr:unnamed protein product [Ostreobium quekettii]|eukprot:evm.model.scf_26.6 EVM.evm.TU.scf_26.6   scf_26:39338-42760(-)
MRAAGRLGAAGMAAARVAHIALAACVLAAVLSGVADSEPISEWMEGSTNHFGGPAEGDPFNPLVPIGGCSYGELNPREFPFYNILSVAPDSELVSDKSMGGCGACYEIQCADSVEKCNNGPFSNSVEAMIGGTCLGGCHSTNVNLHVFAFDKLAPIRLGNIRIRLRQVECKPKANIVLKVKTYRVEEGGYIKFVIRNVPGDGGLRSVELKGARENGGWRLADNLFGAAWEASVLPDAPLDIRLTNVQGEQLVLKNVIKTPGFLGDIVSDGQFSTAAPGKTSSGLHPHPPTPQAQRRSQPAPEPQPLHSPSPSSWSALPSSNISSIRVGPSAAPGSEFPSGVSASPPDEAAKPVAGISASIMEALRGFLLGPAELATPGDASAGHKDASAVTVLEFPVLSGR